MNTADLDRLKRILAKLEEASDVFRRSTSKAVVGDIEAERSLSMFRVEIRRLIATDPMPPDFW